MDFYWVQKLLDTVSNQPYYIKNVMEFSKCAEIFENVCRWNEIKTAELFDSFLSGHLQKYS